MTLRPSPRGSWGRPLYPRLARILQGSTSKLRALKAPGSRRFLPRPGALSGPLGPLRPAQGQALPLLPSGGLTAGAAAFPSVLPPGRAGLGGAVLRCGRSGRSQTPAERAAPWRAVPRRPAEEGARAPGRPPGPAPQPWVAQPRAPARDSGSQALTSAKKPRQGWGGRHGADPDAADPGPGRLSFRRVPARLLAAAPPAGAEGPLRSPPPSSRTPPRSGAPPSLTSVPRLPPPRPQPGWAPRTREGRGASASPGRGSGVGGRANAVWRSSSAHPALPPGGLATTPVRHWGRAARPAARGVLTSGRSKNLSLSKVVLILKH